jgi:hypothetical protein
MYGVSLNPAVAHFPSCTSLHTHNTLPAVLRRQLNSPSENRTGTSLDAGKSHTYFNFTDVCRMKQARSPQGRDKDCTPNLIKNFTFIWPHNVTNFLIIKPTRCTVFSNLFWNGTLRVSDSSSAHHQELFTVHSAMVYVKQVSRQLSSSSRIRTELCSILVLLESCLQTCLQKGNTAPRRSQYIF